VIRARKEVTVTVEKPAAAQVTKRLSLVQYQEQEQQEQQSGAKEQKITELRVAAVAAAVGWLS